MRLDNVDLQTLRVLNDAADKELTRWFRSLLAGTVARITRKGSITDTAEKALRECLPLVWQDLHKCGPNTIPSQMPEHVTAAIVVLMRLKFSNPTAPFIRLAHNAAHALVPEAVMHEMRCQLPPARRERKAKADDPADARTAKIDEKVRAWERKLRYAKTKLDGYRRKQARLNKKGMVK